jgi:DNA modification methylase
VSDYRAFLATKLPRSIASGIAVGDLHPSLFGFQQGITGWALRHGRAAIFADTGLGKTRMQVEWLSKVVQPGERGLIFAPLAVAEQTITEAAKLGIEIHFADATRTEPGLYITNYEKLHRFDPDAFAAVVLDESSILKSVDGKTREQLIREWTGVNYRLCCTATPAPNDIAELANHAEFLGVRRRAEMLAEFFTHDDTGWRLKGHAERAFYDWMATWSVYIRRPSDLGFDDEDFELPPLRVRDEIVHVDLEPGDGMLFPDLAGGIKGARTARKQSVEERVDRAAEIVRQSPGQWLIWAGLNAEQDAIAARLGEDCVSISGTTPIEDRVALYQRWASGDVQTLVSKASIFGFGVNMQHCHQVLFLGTDYSFESYYQAVRRCWRYGQSEPVDVAIVISDQEGRVADSLRTKEREHLDTAERVIASMRDAERREVLADATAAVDEAPATYVEGDRYRLWNGDCIEVMGSLPDASVHLSLHSPPFAGLYVYSPSARDVGNVRDYEQFFEHYRYAVDQLRRITVPGRRACVHVAQVSTTKATHGEIGWFDFRAETVKLYRECGWIYDGEICIQKNPQAQAIRTHSKALLFAQLKRDRSWLRPAMADYILLFRAPGENPIAITEDQVENEDWISWAHPIWTDIRETEVLPYTGARDQRDERHITPLQLEVCRRCVRLWSQPGEVVLDPFAGVGTVPFMAAKHERVGWGIELKQSYFAQARRNLSAATDQLSLLDHAG